MVELEKALRRQNGPMQKLSSGGAQSDGGTLLCARAITRWRSGFVLVGAGPKKCLVGMPSGCRPNGSTLLHVGKFVDADPIDPHDAVARIGQFFVGGCDALVAAPVLIFSVDDDVHRFI